MSRTAKIAATAAILGAVAIPASVLAGSLGGSNRPGQAPLRGIANAPLHVVGAPAAGVAADETAAAKRSGSHGVSLAYLQTKRQSVPPGRSSFKIGPTPRRCRAINGYYFIPHQRQTKVVSEGDSLAGFRHWIFYRNNHTGSTVDNVVYGVVCIRGAHLIGG